MIWISGRSVSNGVRLRCHRVLDKIRLCPFNTQVSGRHVSAFTMCSSNRLAAQAATSLYKFGALQMALRWRGLVPELCMKIGKLARV